MSGHRAVCYSAFAGRDDTDLPRKWPAIADEVGGNISTYWEPDFAQIRLVTTTAMFNRAMTLVGEALNQANFEQKWVEKVRGDLLRRAGESSDDLFDTSYSTLRGLLYQDNGYHRPDSGSMRTFRFATADDLTKFYSSYYVPNNMVISIVGDVTVSQAMDRVQKAFAGVLPAKLPGTGACRTRNSTAAGSMRRKSTFRLPI